MSFVRDRRRVENKGFLVQDHSPRQSALSPILIVQSKRIAHTLMLSSGSSAFSLSLSVRRQFALLGEIVLSPSGAYISRKTIALFHVAWFDAIGEAKISWSTSEPTVLPRLSRVSEVIGVESFMPTFLSESFAETDVSGRSFGPPTPPKVLQ